jgi:hypothetical protein
MSSNRQEGELNDFDKLLRERRNALGDKRDDRESFEILDALISTSEACKHGLVRVEVGYAVRRIYVGKEKVCSFHYEGAHIVLIVPGRSGGTGMRMTADPEDILHCIANLVADAELEADRLSRPPISP